MVRHAPTEIFYEGLICMLRWIVRFMLVLWSSFILLTLAAHLLGTWQGRDTFIYAAAVPDDILATDVRLYDVQSGVSTRYFRRIDLMGMDVATDGRFILAEQRLRRGSELQIIELATGTVHPIFQGEFDVARWSPDGQWIGYRNTGSFEDGDGLRRVPVTGGYNDRIAPPNLVFAFSADGEAVYYSAWGTNDENDIGIVRRDITTGQTTALIPDRMYISDMETYGDFIAFIGNRAPHILNVATGDVFRLGNEVGVGASVAWSLDGNRLAIVLGQSQTDTTVRLMNRTGAVLGEFNLPDKIYGSRIGWVDLR
jgi:tricorn protease-like protein